MRRSARKVLCGAVALALSLSACSSDDDGPSMLNGALIAEFDSGLGIQISSDEADCLDKHFSDALDIAYPATWEAYESAVDERRATVVSAIEATGVVPPDPLGVGAWRACLSSDHAAQLFAVGLIAPIKWSDLSTSERQCVLAETSPYGGSIPDDGIETGVIEGVCGL